MSLSRKSRTFGIWRCCPVSSVLAITIADDLSPAKLAEIDGTLPCLCPHTAGLPDRLHSLAQLHSGAARALSLEWGQRSKLYRHTAYVAGI